MQQDFSAADGVMIAYDLLGSGPPLYVCHGGPFQTVELVKRDFAPLYDRRSLAFADYRGSGRSGSAPDATYNFATMANDLDQLRQHLGHNRIDLLAHSMGVWVALAFAIQHPESLHRLVLLGGTPLAPARMQLQMMKALGAPRVARLTALHASYVVRWSWRPSTTGATDALMHMSRIAQEGRPEHRDAIAHRPITQDNANAETLLKEAMAVDHVSQLPSIRAPTLVILGTRDAMAVAGARYFERLPRARLRALKGVGHEVLIEEPEEVTDEILRFLDVPG
jgi:pimeloyl-ACP methyl ester carboxylesterase